MITLHGSEMETLISALGGEPGRNGRTRCFLHGGSNPTSFSYTEEGLWYCFAEGKGGDAVDLVMEARGCSRREALEFLADLGIVEARLALRSRRERRRVEEQLRERDELRRKVLRYASALWKATERAAKKYLQEADLNLYLEISRHFEALKKRCANPGPDAAQSLCRMRGAAREFFSRLPLSDLERKAARTLLEWPPAYGLIHRLSRIPAPRRKAA